MDCRLKLISASSIALLRHCPRKYQMQKLSPDFERESTVHTAYGSMFGEGVQSILAGVPKERAIVAAATKWNVDLDEVDGNKSFWLCCQALMDFANFGQAELTDQYEVVMYNGRPTSELGFCIDLGDGFYYRGFMDLVLRNIHSGRILVMDIKTTGSYEVSGIQYQHSDQGISYSVVLDHVVPGINSYDVLYFEYNTRYGKFFQHMYTKDYLERANWIRDLMLEKQKMMMYGEYDSWPKHGGYGCKSFKGSCFWIDSCSMATSSFHTKDIDMDGLEYERFKQELASELGEAQDSGTREYKYDIMVTINDLIQSQLALEASHE
jgi:PD-(D/E)XK nuclease superfamily